jgi:hypothetical protein
LDGLCGDYADAHRERASVSGMALARGQIKMCQHKAERHASSII